ncbi:hypothetical protein E4U41_003755, partial [Claviceps citrina]
MDKAEQARAEGAGAGAGAGAERQDLFVRRKIRQQHGSVCSDAAGVARQCRHGSMRFDADSERRASEVDARAAREHGEERRAGRGTHQ